MKRHPNINSFQVYVISSHPIERGIKTKNIMRVTIQCLYSLSHWPYITMCMMFMQRNGCKEKSDTFLEYFSTLAFHSNKPKIFGVVTFCQRRGWGMWQCSMVHNNHPHLPFELEGFWGVKNGASTSSCIAKVQSTIWSR